MGDQGPVTLRDVAREAGVSYATASRALNGSERTVRAENAARVREAAARLGYLPFLPAQAVARGSSRTAALVVADMDDPYFASIAVGVVDAADDAGLIVTMAVADRTPELEVQLVHKLRGHRPQVILIAGSRIDDPPGDTPVSDTPVDTPAGHGPVGDGLVAELEAYRSAGGRVALISQEGLPFPTVAIDNYGGARALARTLVGLGYESLAIVHSGDRIRTSRDRRRGFTDGLREAGLEAALVEAEFSRAGGRRAGRVLPVGVQAVFAVNDVMAIGAMTGLREAGREPGRDVAVAGFDDVEDARYATPALTTVRVPLRETGRLVLRTALDEPRSGVLTVPVEVVVRASTPGLSGSRAVAAR